MNSRIFYAVLILYFAFAYKKKTNKNNKISKRNERRKENTSGKSIKKNILAAARVNIFFVTRTSGNKSAFSGPIKIFQTLFECFYCQIQTMLPRIQEIQFVMFYPIWYHLYDLKNVENTHGGVLLLVKLQATSL